MLHPAPAVKPIFRAGYGVGRQAKEGWEWGSGSGEGRFSGGEKFLPAWPDSGSGAPLLGRLVTYGFSPENA